MSDHTSCAQCGAPMAPDAPEGLCPPCLLRRGLETQTAGGAPAADFTPPTPEELARYFPQLEILELLGRGGMGVVYKARQRELDRLVALKILPSASDRDPAFAERFTREARALARLSHPNIVAVYDFGQTSGLAYFVMEFVDGLNLRQLQASARITPAEALAIVPQICDALQTAHDQGIVHRDIKPENILIDKKGRVKIADFGIAKIIGADQRDLTLTAAGEMVGTPAYMAPEQIEHPMDVDHRADIYSLGVVFYQMLTGELPLGKFAPPSRKVTIDVRLDDVVLRALEKEPQLRYQQAHEVRAQVETIAGTSDQNPASAQNSPVSTHELDRVRRSLMAWSIPTALAAIYAANYIKTYVWAAGAIVFAAAAVLISTLIMALAASAPRNYLKLKIAAQLINIEMAGIVAVLAWLAWHTDQLMTPWRICLMLIFGYMIVCGCLKLACLWPDGRGFWAPDANRNQPLGYIALCFAALSGLIPTLCFWMAPSIMPWLSADDRQIAIWATLWTALAAVLTGIGARKVWTGRYSIALGGVNLTVWLMFFMSGPRSAHHHSYSSNPAMQTITAYQWQPISNNPQVESLIHDPAFGNDPVLHIKNNTNAPLQLSLLTINHPPVTSMHYSLTGQVKYENVQAPGYLQLLNYFKEGYFFSRTLAPAGAGEMAQLAGTSAWRDFMLPFDRTGTKAPPNKLEFGIFLPGGGEVSLGPLTLTQEPDSKTAH